MIEQIDGRPEGTLEFRIIGRVTGDDYKNVLVPAMNKATEYGDPVRVLVQVGPGFEGYDAEALKDDMQMGLRHWRGFDRIAVVTDSDSARDTMKWVAVMMPCPVMVFPLDELDAARRWLAESLGALHTIDLGGRHLEVAFLGKLDSLSITDGEQDINAFINREGGVDVLVDLRGFDGWQGLDALAQHFKLIRDHYDIPNHIAVVGNTDWQRLAERVMSRFVKADIRFFEGERYEEAKAWIMAQ
ncbi:STAS/SEC14 domain-containing protein [Tropicimonas sp.]|uniref:STAS/SEC14 domain-containing protein n=1 Tax=Tropicimonas sp. TaxID=2067044 RepID=UPI003A863217